MCASNISDAQVIGQRPQFLNIEHIHVMEYTIMDGPTCTLYSYMITEVEVPNQFLSGDQLQPYVSTSVS